MVAGALNMHAGENPFSVQRIHGLHYEFGEGQSLAATAGMFWQQFERGWQRQALWGPHGSGKSTLLRDLGDYWVEQGLTVHRWRANNAPQRPFSSPRRVLLVDSGETLGWAAWQWLHWQYRGWGILTTSHHRQWAPVLHECRTSPDQFVRLAQALLREQSPDMQAAFGREFLLAAFARSQGNVRNGFFELYDTALRW